MSMEGVKEFEQVEIAIKWNEAGLNDKKPHLSSESVVSKWFQILQYDSSPFTIISHFMADNSTLCDNR